MNPHMPFPQRLLPPMARIRRALPTEHVADAGREVYQQLVDFGLRGKVRPGARIAITAGSRGMGGFLDLLRGIVAAVKQFGGEPFLIPAMGSHGGATAEGQTEILRRLGVTEESVGAPVRATMETFTLGPAKNGAVAHLDRLAAEADGIVVFGRTKTHPESADKLASGLLKMTVVGLGKQKGAQQAHSHGLWESVREVPKITMRQAKILCGVAMVENPYRQPAVVEVVRPEYQAFLKSDERLLEIARPLVPKLPFDKLDLLIVDEIGKTISGTGMDLNVIGRFRATCKGKREPDIKRIVALSLTKPSLGNGLGIGLADFTTRRFMAEYDAGATYVNLLTATEPGNTTSEAPLPLALENDREAMEVALYSALANDSPSICRIHNTARLDEMWISESLVEEARKEKEIAVEQAAEEFAYDAAGNLV